jgi:hypothetical protein
MPDFNINLELIAGSKGQLVVNVRSGNGTIIRQETACTVRGWQSCFEASYKAITKAYNAALYDSVDIRFTGSGAMFGQATNYFKTYLSGITSAGGN